MNSQVNEIKQKVDIVELVGESVSLKKAGRHFKGLCPFHSEKSPSFIVSPERQSYKCFGCFPPGVLIATPTNLVPIEKIKQGDWVIGGSGKNRQVTRLLERQYAGKMCDVYLTKLGGYTRLTHDHKVKVIDGAPYTRKYKNFSKRYRKYLKLSEEKYRNKVKRYFPIKEFSAGELQKGDLLLYPINSDVKSIKTINLSKYITKKLPPHGKKPRKIDYIVQANEELLQLIGYYLAEGSSHRAYLRFSLGNHEMDFASDIQKLLKSLFGLESGIHVRSGRKTGIEITCCHSLLADAFRNMCGKGAKNKHIPYELMKIDSKKQMILVMAMVRGDGHTFVGHKSKYSLRKHIALTSISREMIFQTRNILLRNGFFPTEYFEKEKIDKNGVHHKEAYNIQWAEDGFSKYSLIYRDGEGLRYWILPIKEIVESDYRGVVYNFTVDQDHSYLPVNFVVGNCGEFGDSISFLQKYDGMSFLESLESLANRVGVELVSYQPTAQDSQKKRLLSIMSQASEFYQYLLNTHKAGEEAREYLKERKINSEATKLYGLGYSPKQWQGVSTYLVNKKGYTMEELAAAGLVIRSEAGHYYDRFRGRVMFPLRDHKGSVVGFSGRTLSQDEKEAKYINSPETSIYHKSRMLYGLFENREAIRKSDQIILVEGELDVLPSYQAGVKNVVAIKGSAFTGEMGRLIARYTRNVVYALDADKAGQEAVRRAVLVADPLDLSVRVIQITGGKDPGDVASESPESWRKMVKGATLYWDYLINTACERHDPSSGTGASAISQEVVPTLAMISNQIVKAHYAQLLAKKLSVPEESIFEEIERVDKKQKLSSLKQVVKKIEKGESVGRRDKVEEYLLSLSLQFYPSVKDKLEEIRSEWFNVPVVSKILNELVKYEGEWSIEEFGKKLKPEMIAVLDRAYLTDLSEVANSEKEWVKVRREVEEMYLRDKLKRLSGEIEKAEKGEKEKELASAQKEFSRVSKQLSEL